MPLDPVFGLKFIRVDDQAQPVLGAQLDVVGIVGPSSTADPNTFPLDTPVYVASNDTVTLAKLGTDGYIPDAINAINDQLADFQVAAQIVIVRTAYGTSMTFAIQLQQTIANIMGSSVTGTGVWALLQAPTLLFTTPRLILAPGYTGQMANSLDSLVIAAVGHGYIPNQLYAITFVQGGGETNGAQLVLPAAHAIADSRGNIDNAQVFIDTFGAWMTVAPTATLPAPDGPSIPAIAATGEVLFSANPGVGATLTLNGTVVSFVASGASGTQVNIGANLLATVAALQVMADASADTNLEVGSYAVGPTGLSLIITAEVAGAAGNSFTLASTVGGASLSGFHLTGGADAVTPVRATLTPAIALGANPICATLGGGVLSALMGHAVVESSGISLIADEQWRNTLNSQRLIPISGGVKVLDAGGNVVVMPFAPRVVGRMIARDYQTGYPFHSAANQPIAGIVGPSRTIGFSLTDGATEGQQLLSANIGILVRGLIGVETAISSGGFVFVGTDNAGDDALWQFYNVTRGRDFIELSLMPALRTYLGRNNIDRQTVINVVTTINDFLTQLTALQQILGGVANFQGSLNSAAEIRLGHLTVGFAAEEPPVLRKITTMSARYRPAIDTLVSELQAQLGG